MVDFKVLLLGSCAQMPASSLPFRTILVLWNILQSYCRIIPDVNVIKIFFSIFSLPSGTGKSHWELDPVNRKGVPAQLFVF
jgi:hypothetical protein